MTDEQTLILAYLRNHEGETAEDILNALAADPTDHRRDLANALQSLIWKEKLIAQDIVTGALTLREAAK